MACTPRWSDFLPPSLTAMLLGITISRVMYAGRPLGQRWQVLKGVAKCSFDRRQTLGPVRDQSHQAPSLKQINQGMAEFEKKLDIAVFEQVVFRNLVSDDETCS